VWEKHNTVCGCTALRDVSLAAFAVTELNEMFSGRRQRQCGKVSGRNVGRPSYLAAAVCLRTFHWTIQRMCSHLNLKMYKRTNKVTILTNSVERNPYLWTDSSLTSYEIPCILRPSQVIIVSTKLRHLLLFSDTPVQSALPHTFLKDPFQYDMSISGNRGSTVVKVLCWKSEGRWFDPS